MSIDLDQLSPKEIVQELDRYIVGQEPAKKAVAVALRNRLRRRNGSPPPPDGSAAPARRAPRRGSPAGRRLPGPARRQ